MADTAPPPTRPSPPPNDDSVGAAPQSTGAQPGSPEKQAQAQTQGPAQNPAQPPQTQTQTQTSQNAATASSTDQSRGLPYYEKLRRDLRDTLQKKRLMDKSMAQLEDQIYRFEQSYLEETTAGNIIKGFDNYIKGSSTGSTLTTGIGLSGAGMGTAGGGARRKAQVTEADRVFSKSSAGFMRESPTPSSTQTTPAPTPLSNGGDATNGNSKAGSKNKKKSGNKNVEEDVEDSDKPPVKRLKISYGRD
ncbi:chromatin modification-related protein EAF6/MEAF6 [Aspergillus ruber CBS 135680]|uniref:Chromatin modification-related protein EAF6 n=1 Tax=Aspergillus ruber (strain CBS 135680) TaxID=1388766 RepID=A0A017SQY7_ASPRC|nr:NuA4-domain-containing protein [Aspergillus ruber CBS 135680]EYE99226.1 NuA4-domain-containing protein [Aspergillus ruber CBS 135680]